MIESEVQLRTPDGSCDGVFYRHEDGRRRPGVIHLTDIRGIRPSKRELAGRLAATGYSVLMPNVFYRTARPPIWDFPMVAGEERTVKRMAELTGSLTPEAVERDAASYLEFLDGQDAVALGPVGVVGYCFTGGIALRLAAALPARIAAVASFHGGGLWSDAPTSPHLLLPRIRARLYFGHAFEDRSMPAEAIANLERALESWGGRYESRVYPGARHGWTVPDSAAFDRERADEAFSKLLELFAGTLIAAG